MAFIEINNIHVHYECWNEQGDETVILLHGFTGSTKTWHEVAALLPKTYRIIAVDLIGHGQTDSPEEATYYTMKYQIKLLHKLFEELQSSKDDYRTKTTSGDNITIDFKRMSQKDINDIAKRI